MAWCPLGYHSCLYPAAGKADQCGGDLPVLFFQSLGPEEAYIPLVIGKNQLWSVKAAREATKTYSAPGRHFLALSVPQNGEYQFG